MARRGVLGIRNDRPARVLVALFGLVLATGTVALMLPFSSREPGGTSLLTALFTATSAVTVTGLTVVETFDHWTGAGQLVLLVLFQLGGLGIVTLASLVGVIVSRRIGLRGRRVAQIESGGLDLGDVRRVLRGVITLALSIEAVLFVALTALFWTRTGASFGRSLELGAFHAVSVFNNAGFSLFPDSLAPFRTDILVGVVVMAGVVAGAVGFPVLTDIRHQPRRAPRWSLHTKLTLFVTAVVLAVGTLVLLVFEWTNPATLGDLETGNKLLAATFNTTMRTAGFSTIDYGAANETTQLATVISMFIGGGSVSAAGGIKVTTLALLVLAVWSEFRGDDDVTAFGRRIPTGSVRQAVAVTLAGTVILLVGTFVLLATNGFPLAETAFEATSAFGIVGLSAGITPDLDGAGRVTVIVLMILGRLGPLTVGTALILRERERLYRYPEERPFIG